MADQTETVTEATIETIVKTEPPKQTAGKTLDELQAENERMAKALREANQEAAARRKKLEELEKAEEARKNAELSEAERLKKENESLRATAEAANKALLQRGVADEIGLPIVFATRIVGADREAMLADAKAMLEALPKVKPAPGTPTNPGAASSGETDDEKRRRLGLR